MDDVLSLTNRKINIYGSTFGLATDEFSCWLD